MPAKELDSPCMDCKDTESVLTVRRRQLCGACFKRFVSYKVFRRMEKYKPPRNPQDPRHQLLLPLSFGVSSSVLLRMLDAELERQRSKNFARNTFDLHVLVIEPSTMAGSSVPYDRNYEAVQKIFPQHTYSQVPFHSIFEYVPDMNEIMREYTGPQFTDDSSRSNAERLAAFRAAISTATSATDVDSVLLTRLVAAFAKQSGCETVLWGDSDSRLAAKALAGVAKGRGASLTWRVSDGVSPWGLQFDFPLRDLYKAELIQYESVCPELAEIIIPDEPPSDNVLTKNLSIDELMMRYVETQGAKYPGVMANVARTVNKLETSNSGNASCGLCGGLVGNVKRNSGVTVSSQAESSGSPFCYGCMRSRPEINC